MKKIIKKRYYEVIRVLVVDDRPVTNINFKAIFFFLLMAFLMNISMSFGIEMLGDFPNTILRRQLLIGLLVYSGLSLLMFLLFQRFSESKHLYHDYAEIPSGSGYRGYPASGKRPCS